MNAPGTITLKVVLDTAEAEAQLAALTRKAAVRRRDESDLLGRGGLTPSAWACSIAERFAGTVIPLEDAEFLISTIKARVAS
jgi:hypothetical protein